MKRHAIFVDAGYVLPRVQLPFSDVMPHEHRGATKTIDQIIEEAIQRTLIPGDAEEAPRLKAALADSKGVPLEYDRRLLGTCRTLLQRDLTGHERREMRSVFRCKILS
jgi:hypothetical protein